MENTISMMHSPVKIKTRYNLHVLQFVFSVLYIVRVVKGRNSMGETRNPYQILVGKPQGKRPLKVWKERWKYNIKMDNHHHYRLHS